MRLAALGLALAALPACTADAPPAPPPPADAAGAAVTTVSVPAGPNAVAPRLARDADGRLLLSWTEPDGDGHALRYAVWADTGWSAPRTADTGPSRFVNWADTPGVLPLPGGRLLAHVRTMHPAGDSPYAYDVSVRQSSGAAWGEAALVHDDGVAGEHGFVSALPLPDGRTALVWLDGRETGGGGHGGHGGGAMTLRYAALAPDGTRSDEAVLDARTCDCCPTAMALTGRGPVVAYRDRSEGEVRDIAVVRQVDGAWTEPSVVHADGWEIAGCPVNGPALVADGDRVALAWFTAAGGAARVRVALSTDAGATFGAPVDLDDGEPIGRVGAVRLPDGAVVVSWLERAGDRAALRFRRVAPDGTAEPARTVATTDAGRSSGVPVLEAWGDRVVVAWTDPGQSPALRSAVVAL